MKKITFYLLLIILTALSSGVMGATTNADSVRAIRGIRGKIIQSDSLIIAKRDSAKVVSCDTIRSKVSIRDSSASRIMRAKAMILRDTNKVSSINILQVQDTLQNGSANTGTSTAISNNWEAFKFTASTNMTVSSFGIQVKRTGTISNNTGLAFFFLYTDNAGVPGSVVTGGSLSFSLMYTTLITSFAEIIVYKSLAGMALISGTSYWIVINNNVVPTGGTVQWNTANTGTAMYATSSDGTSWTSVDNVTGWYRLYGSTSNCVSVVGFTGDPITATCYGTTAISAIAFGSAATPTISGTAFRGYGVSGSSAHNVGIYGTSTDGIGTEGVSTGAGGIGGFFIGGTTTGYGISVQKGVLTDSVIIKNTLSSSDSSTTAPATGTPTSATSYYGGNTVILTTPDAWWHIKMKGVGGTYVDYKIPVYK